MRLGSYEVVSSLGAGGMGEVYRARDTKLGRDVALKILPELFAAEPDRLARFDREARTLAGLNHPNIAAIYGIEDSGTSRALVMELVEGEDLSQRLARGALPLPEALPIARQIADALEAAHEAGIIHRDLKPANIKVRDDGTVKVLDFGLAKALAPDGGLRAPVTDSPTLTARATQLGTIIGTAAYMAPEQARGKAVDRRADVWAFGVVLYEMVTGRRAFEGDEISDVLAAVLRHDLDWAALPAGTPASIHRLLRRCLEKDRRERLADMSAARLEIKDAMAGAPSDPAPAAPAPPRTTSSPWMLVATAAATALVVGVGFWAWWRPPAPAPSNVIRTMIPLPPGEMLPIRSGTFGGPVAISATHVAYPAGPQRQLYLRALSSADAVPVPGATSAMTPFFSPDGQWLGFYSERDRRLRKVAVAGGPVSDICTVDQVAGAHWGADATVVFSDLEKGIFTVSSAGGTPKLVVAAEKNSFAVEPAWLPGSPAILYTVVARIGRFDSDMTTARIQIVTLDAGTRPTELTMGYRARYVANGYLVFIRGDALVGMPLDPIARATSGSPEALIADVARSAFDVSAEGSLAYVTGIVDAPRTFVWVDRQGRIEPTGIRPQLYAYPRISPDGTRIVIDSRQDERDLWIWNIRLKTLTRLTSERGQDSYPVWTPDGRRIIYGAQTTGAEENLASRSADGTGPVENLLASDRHQAPYAISPDGAWLVFRDEVAKEGTNLALMQMKDHHVKALIATRFNERNAEISPDGRWMAYQSDETGATEVYVRPFPDVEAGKTQVSSGGGQRPVWSRDGRELFYLGADASVPTMKRAARQPGKALEFSPPQTLFDASAFYLGTFLGRTYDVGPDGRFLMQRIESPDRAAAPLGISLVLNWTQELLARQRAAGRIP